MSSKVEGSTAPDVTWTGGAHVQGFGPKKDRGLLGHLLVVVPGNIYLHSPQRRYVDMWQMAYLVLKICIIKPRHGIGLLMQKCLIFIEQAYYHCYHYMRVNLCLSRENMLVKHFLGFLLLVHFEFNYKGVYSIAIFYTPCPNHS